MPYRRPTPGWPIGRLVVGCPQGIFRGLSYYLLVIFFFNMVPLIMEFTEHISDHSVPSFTAYSRIMFLFTNSLHLCSRNSPNCNRTASLNLINSTIGVRRWVSKREEEGRRPPALRAGFHRNGHTQKRP
jgi:hypothetical protein